MGRVLTILEVSQKQNYIFSSKRLRANAERSNEIAYVTGSEFFRESARDLYDERQNLVYAGGGHTVLQFDSREQAVAFTQKATEAAVRRFDGMEMFATSIAYDESKTAGENLTALTAALERKKALREHEDDVLSYMEDFEKRRNVLGRNRNFWNLPLEGREKPVFYVQYEGHVYFGMSRFLRIGYRYPLSCGLPESHKAGMDKLDFPRTILGYVSKNSGSYRSRVSFGDFAADGEA